MVGRSPAMQAVFDVLGKASTSDATILLEGETGTGKEVSAEAIHRGSPRRDKPFLVVDCGAMPPQLLESELFGHERGAFTGAVSSRQGVFEAANGGTVFLDEIGELAIDLQPKLLRVLERREVRRVGTNNHVPVNVRLIAATNRSLREQVGRAQVPLRPLLPARGRRGEAAAAARAPGRSARCWSSTSCATSAPSTSDALATVRSPEFLGALAEHSWPGNIRELRNYLERCVALRDFAPPRSAGAVGAGPRARERRQHRPAAARGARGLGQHVRAPLPGGAAAPAREPRQRRGARGGRRSHLLLPPALEARPAPARSVDRRRRRQRRSVVPDRPAESVRPRRAIAQA